MSRQKPLPLPRQYSAEIVRSDGDAGRVFVDGLLRRTEATVNGTTSIAISRPDLCCLYMLFPDTKSYMASPLTDDFLSVVETDDVGEQWEFVRDDLLDGETVKCFHAYLPGQLRPYEVVYVQPETGIRVRAVTYNQNGDEVLTIETRNVVIGPPPKEVFEIPEGYEAV